MVLNNAHDDRPARDPDKPRMGRPPKLNAPKQVAFRLPRAPIARLERRPEAARREAPGATLTLSDVAREPLTAALERVEAKRKT